MPRWSALVVLVLLGACDAEVERAHVELTNPDGTCRSSVVDQIDGVTVELRRGGQAGQPICLPITEIELKSIEGLQGELSRTTRFSELEEGDYSIVIVGYDNGCPSPNHPLLCGHADFGLPADGPITLPLTCHEGSSPPTAFSACTNW
jgi:hypothetical protein